MNGSVVFFEIMSRKSLPPLKTFGEAVAAGADAYAMSLLDTGLPPPHRTYYAQLPFLCLLLTLLNLLFWYLAIRPPGPGSRWAVCV